MASIKKQLEPKKFSEVELKKSAGILDDFAIRKNVATREGTIEKVPVDNSDIANKKYVDDSLSFWDAVNEILTAKTFNATDEDNVLQVDRTTIIKTGDLVDNNLFIGESAGGNASGVTNSVLIGKNAGFGGSGVVNSGDYAIAIGRKSAYSNRTGLYNMSIGYQSLEGNRTGHYNCAIGANSCYKMTAETNNVAIGTSSLYNCTGSNNVAIGGSAGKRSTTGDNLLIIDNQDRGTAANEPNECLIYGVFANDVTTQRLKVNGAIASQTKTFSTEGPTDNVNVTGVNTIFCDTSSNNVTIGGFAGGVAGQLLNVVKTSTSNGLKLEDNEGGGSQDIFTFGAADVTLEAGKRGGFNLICDGSDWYATNHAT